MEFYKPHQLEQMSVLYSIVTLVKDCIILLDCFILALDSVSNTLNCTRFHVFYRIQ